MASLSALSCGYSLTSALPANFRTIYVEPLKNNITYTSDGGRNLYLPLLEVKVRNAIINRYLFDGNLKIAAPEESDLTLKGELKRYDRGALRYAENNQDVQEYRVQIFVSLELWDNHTNELVWKEEDFVGEATYFVTGALAKSEDAAVGDAITDLARRIVERTIENW